MEEYCCEEMKRFCHEHDGYILVHSDDASERLQISFFPWKQQIEYRGNWIAIKHIIYYCPFCGKKLSKEESVGTPDMI